jgi:hypothetical protein
MSGYPYNPGSKRLHSRGSDTSAGATNPLRTGTQRAYAYQALVEMGEATPEQIVEHLAKQGYDIMLMSCRPRCSELARLGLILDTTKRGKGFGGSPAMVWRPTTELEQAALRVEREAERVTA